MELISKKVLIGTTIATVIIIISSFISWFSFKAVVNKEFIEVKATGWDGSVSLWEITIENWLMTLLILIYLGILCLKNLKIWNPSLWWFLPLLGIVILHMVGFFSYLFTASEHYEVKLRPGYFLMLVVSLACIILSVNLIRAQKRN